MVTYPLTKLPIPGLRVGIVELGGLTYSRKLLEGDDPRAEYKRIYEFLEREAERAGQKRLRELAEDVEIANQANRARVAKPGQE